MAFRTKILSEKKVKDECLSYHAFPVGYANADFEGGLSNPFLTGIKVSKYQRSAPKPVSADVMAVNSAKFMTGNRQQNARNLLSQYQTEVKAWKPPPVNLRTADEIWDQVSERLIDQGRLTEIGEYPDQPEDVKAEIRREREDIFYDKQARSVAQARIAAASRGTQLVVQSIATQADIPSMAEILARYRSLPNKDKQKTMLTEVLDVLRSESILLPGLDIKKAQYGKNSEREEQVKIIVERAYAQGSQVQFLDAFTVQLATNPPVASKTPSPPTSPPTSPPMGTGSSSSGAITSYAQATTQGTALSTTTKTTPEVQKK